MQLATVGIDLGKTTFHVIGVGRQGAIVLRRRLTKRRLIELMDRLPPALVGMEASCGAHHLARTLMAMGHDARLIPAQYVKPFVKSHKNDYLDAEAITEAVQRPTMRFVPVKTEEQLDVQALHRVRDRLVARRTAIINQTRAFLLERGLTFPKGRRTFARLLGELLAAGDTAELSPRIRALLGSLWDEWQEVEHRIKRVTDGIETIAREDEAVRRLVSIPGFGPVVATALVAAVSDGSAFRRARDMSAWIGLVPRQHSTGGRTKLLGISKTGNAYLRRLIIVGAQSARLHLDRGNHERLGPWLDAIERRTNRNVAVVALANKLVRIAWAVLRKGGTYQPVAPKTSAA